MPLLTDLLRAEVRDESGAPLGRIVDLVADIDAELPAVERVVLGSARRPQVATVIGFDADLAELTVRPSGAPGGSIAQILTPSEVLVCRDILDTQVIDIRGKRSARVSDVVLESSGGKPLVVAGVDLGFGAVLRRIGLRALVRREPDIVPWQHLHLNSARGHVVQLDSTAAAMHRLDEQQLADLVARLPVHRAAEILRRVPATHAADALHRSHPATRDRLVRNLHRHAHHDVMAELQQRHGQVMDIAGPPPRRMWRHRGWVRQLPSASADTRTSGAADGADEDGA